MYTTAQLRYLAHWLTRSGPAEDALVSTVAQSRVDLNPHQVEAALFALRGTERSSAFAKGVLLADEVGLGKTIEAGLVLGGRPDGRREGLGGGALVSLRHASQRRRGRQAVGLSADPARRLRPAVDDRGAACAIRAAMKSGKH